MRRLVWMLDAESLNASPRRVAEPHGKAIPASIGDERRQRDGNRIATSCRAL